MNSLGSTNFKNYNCFRFFKKYIKSLEYFRRKKYVISNGVHSSCGLMVEKTDVPHHTVS